jgi:hypothetical protein
MEITATVPEEASSAALVIAAGENGSPDEASRIVA